MDHDYEMPQEVKDKNKDAFEKYCKNHLILKYKPISYICNFSKNKQDFKISRTELTEYYTLESKPEKDKQIIFKYSPIGDLIIFSLEDNIYILSPKNSENKLNKITLLEKVYSFNIHNRNILSICFQNTEAAFFRLTPKFPYYEKDDALPIVESPSEDLAIQIIGNFDKYIVSRTLGGKINLHSDEKKKGNFEIIATDKINYSNNAGSNLYELKAIWKKYVVIKDNDYIVVRDLTKKNLDVSEKQKLLDKTKEKDFIVFNGNIITYGGKEILFYNIPKLELVSKLELLDTVLSVNIVNPRTMIVMEINYVEQLEVNTWKRLYNQINLQPNKNLNNFKPIGAGKKLFFYSKSDNKIYNAFSDKN